uniref:CWH43-like N-terminal domain-containing protein n=1 Tax=Acrobeloides nanus TaxID=290746 RepID=A0A914D7A0_9BILA
MVANFQELNVLAVHYFGAFLAFGCGLIYIWAQTLFSYMMNPKLAKPFVSHCRLLLCIFSTFFFCTTIIFGPILGQPPKTEKQEQREGSPAGCHKLYKWTSHEQNYFEHMIGTCSEWMLAICFQVYILSFAIELRHAYVHAPKLKLIAIYDESTMSVKSGQLGCCDLGLKTVPIEKS